MTTPDLASAIRSTSATDHLSEAAACTSAAREWLTSDDVAALDLATIYAAQARTAMAAAEHRAASLAVNLASVERELVARRATEPRAKVKP